MLIPSIDLMGGKIVQLIQGERKALESDNFFDWIERFRNFPIVQVIDLDAAMGTGSNAAELQRLCCELSCQVGGGLRTSEAVGQVLTWGARKAIIGSSLFGKDGINLVFAQRLAQEFGPERLIFAVDSRGGYVSVKGWTQSTGLRPADAMHMLDPFCSGFLYTHIDTEGTMSGFPTHVLEDLQNATAKKLIVAGGIRSLDEVQHLDTLSIDAVVGMAIYTGLMPV
ncbi:MAG: 1-(5-phosphoribosyl)-5-[(5-phosphoribosylamino)methylideneamino] imidazole-4-carboxamide isomerase [Acidobacteria bacterium]|nr:1-(5-phosphoribosyl)-5-[(5-phosphoribosylamino)methylideneamino] imidazole-4-carboxamide isomerase [Acidobacteriota bacterium]